MMGLFVCQGHSYPEACGDFEHALDGLDGLQADVLGDLHGGPQVAQAVVEFLQRDHAHVVALVAGAALGAVLAGRGAGGVCGDLGGVGVDAVVGG